MENLLKEKFERKLRHLSTSDRLLVDLLLVEAYEIAKSEDAEKIESQQGLLESMGETNKQLAKRLLAIQDALERHASAEAILLILNPTKE